MADWTAVSIRVEDLRALEKQARRHERSVAAELRTILQDAGVTSRPVEAVGG